MHDLLQKCWQFDFAARPTFGEILKLFEANLKVCEVIKQQEEQIEIFILELRKDFFSKYEFES